MSDDNNSNMEIKPIADTDVNTDVNTDTDAKSCIEHIILSGGGHNIFLMLGAITYLKQEGYIDFNTIKTIDATSAGSLLAFTFILGCSDSDLETYFIGRPWEKLFDITPERLFQAFQEKGLFDIKIFEEIMDPILKSVGIERTITFQELYNKTGIEFTVYVTELNILRLLEFSHISTPNTPVFDAVYKSCALPPLFKPVIENEDCYLDGGILACYPINPFLQRNKGIDIDKIFGIKLVYEIGNMSSIDDKSNMGDYMFSLIKKIIQYRDKDSDILPHELLIYGEGMSIDSLKNTIYSLEHRKHLLNEGKRYAFVYHTYKLKELENKN